MESKDVDIKGLETANFATITVDALKRLVPVPGDTIHLILEPDSLDKHRLVPEAALAGENFVISLKQTKQDRHCGNVRIEGELLLHYACQKGASTEVLKYIWETDPKAVMRESSSSGGELPIHSLLKLDETRPSLEKMKLLIEAYPEALAVADEAGCLPLHYACWNENISVDIIQYLVTRYPKGLHQRGGFCDELPLWYAVESELPLHILVTLLRPFPQAVSEWGCFQSVSDHYDQATTKILFEAANQAQQEALLNEELAWVNANLSQLVELLQPPKMEHNAQHQDLDECAVPVFHWIRARAEHSKETLTRTSSSLDNLVETE
ncbi:expressed unknown protein [Seminavis robusta]|uniref:Uncharacterized protein n=1 Tax=Seminavis robusta TaxID=568900 RepID=A0A9N8EK25_9STRA|nr:expressed unknown protein [Seminavis robusta]|eukprot:Sro1312_g261840.1 n/a (323) ;mRNA; r:22079-23047